jgi:hypothetical protein
VKRSVNSCERIKSRKIRKKARNEESIDDGKRKHESSASRKKVKVLPGKQPPKRRRQGRGDTGILAFQSIRGFFLDI